MDVTIYDPDLDPTGEIGRAFAAALSKAFTDERAAGPARVAEAATP